MKAGGTIARMGGGASGEIDRAVEHSRPINWLIRSVRRGANKWASRALGKESESLRRSDEVTSNFSVGGTWPSPFRVAALTPGLPDFLFQLLLSVFATSESVRQSLWYKVRLEFNRAFTRRINNFERRRHEHQTKTISGG